MGHSRGNDIIGGIGSDGNRNGDSLCATYFCEIWYMDNQNMVKDNVEEPREPGDRTNLARPPLPSAAERRVYMHNDIV